MTTQHAHGILQTEKNLRKITEQVPIRPYYEDENTVIYHADNREVLPYLGACDLVISDPPYFRVLSALLLG